MSTKLASIGGLAMTSRPLPSDAGIAIGPILFIIAVLGILASAIAAGSGSFTTNTTGESNRTKAAALIEVGQNLKVGFERLTGSGVVRFDTAASTVNIDPDDTTAPEDLFSPMGGGILAPAISLANDPSTDVWYYPLVNIPKIGTGNTGANGGNQLAVLEVEAGVCDDVNLKIAGLPATPPAEDLGNFSVATLIPAANSADWPAELQGKPTGCVDNNNATTAGYYFYQVIGVR